MAKAIMIQGTTSNAGKSLIAAGLCRIFRQDGYRVAPFKSQNMALNSYITRDGLEMGRAQVMQAEAAGLEPVVDMNPILLKPTSDQGSQVIVNGEVRGVMRAADYYQYKPQLIPDIMAAYGRLDQENDIIVIEGPAARQKLTFGRTILSTWAWRKCPDHQCCWWETLTGEACSPHWLAPCCCWRKKKKG